MTLKRNGTLDFHIVSNGDHDPYDSFLKIMDGDKELDPSAYEIENGSLILKLKAAYLNELVIGTHELHILFKDDKDLFIHFRIIEEEKKEDEKKEEEKEEKKEEKADRYKNPVTGIE